MKKIKPTPELEYLRKRGLWIVQHLNYPCTFFLKVGMHNQRPPVFYSRLSRAMEVKNP